MGVANPEVLGVEISKNVVASGLSRIALFGDSRIAQCGISITPISITNVGTTATVNQPNHRMLIGQEFLPGNSTDAPYNGIHVVSGIVDVNNFTYEMASVPAASPAAGAPVYTDPLRQKDTGFFTWLNPIMGGRLTLVGNRGIAQEQASERVNRIGQVVALDPDICFDFGIVNDVIAGRTADQIIGDLTAIYAALLDAGITVITTTETPLHSSVTGYTAAKGQVILDVNKWMRNFSLVTKGMMLLDGFKIAIDPLSATVQPKANMVWDTDFIHDTPIFARLKAEAASTLLSNLIPAGNTLAVSIADDYDADVNNSNIIRNGLMQGVGGSRIGANNIGDVANDYTVDQGTCSGVVNSVVARADGFGNDQQIVFTSSANGQVGKFYTTLSLHSRVVPGDTVYFECEVSCTALSAFIGLWLRMFIMVDGNIKEIAAKQPDQNQAYSQNDMVSYVYRTQEITIPAGSTITNLTAWMNAYFSGAGGGTFKAGRWVIHKA